jgi:hypothetical protein
MLIGCSVSYCFGDYVVAVAFYTSAASSLSLPLPLASLFLPLSQSRVLVDSPLCVACSLTLSIPLALTIHRQAHRHLQCIHPVLPLATTAPLWLPLCLPLVHFLFRLRRCFSLFVRRVASSSSLSDVCSISLSLALTVIAKLIVVFNEFAQSKPTTRTPTTYRPTRTPTTYHPTRTPTKPPSRTPTSRRKGTPTSRWKGTPTYS